MIYVSYAGISELLPNKWRLVGQTPEVGSDTNIRQWNRLGDHRIRH